MTVLKVDGIKCEKCVERINNVFKDLDITYEVSLENKTVTVDGDEAVVDKVISELDDLGFDAVAE